MSFEAFTETVKKTAETVKELGQVLEDVKKSAERDRAEFWEFVKQKVR